MTLLEQRYSLNFNKIDGWFLFSFIKEMKILNDIHNNLNIQGNILEIGVYHGKSFIPFSFLLKKDEQIIGVDCFQKQEFNSGYSYLCSKKRVELNIKKIYLDKFKDLNYKLIQSNSKDLTHDDYINFIDNKLPYRIIYIDGGHDKNTCDIDLRNASKILCNKGFLIIDDYKNFFQDIKNIPPPGDGVTKSVDEFLLKNKNFKVIKHVYNKLIVQKYYEG